MRRVVVTGMGAVTPLGIGVKAFWAALVAGRSGIGRLSRVDDPRLPSQVAGECTDFDAVATFGAKEARRLDRSAQLALAATDEAWHDSGIEGRVERDRVGVVYGTGIGGIGALMAQTDVLLSKGPGRVSPFTVPMLMPNASAGQLAMRYGLRGPNFCTVTACAASNHAIGLAFQSIRQGDADAMVAGGTESAMVDVAVTAFSQMMALSTRHNDNPPEASRPFDAGRDGFVMGEGAATLILEDRDAALARGARVYAEVAGFGQSADAFHITAPSQDGAGAALAMTRAMESADVRPEDIDYVNAHATSTEAGDIGETRSLKLAFGPAAYQLPVSSTKSMTGHLFGAAGAVEAVATIMTIIDGVIPPTINLTDPDPECDLDYVPNVARRAQVDIAMSNGFGFGGHNAVLVLGRDRG